MQEQGAETVPDRPAPHLIGKSQQTAARVAGFTFLFLMVAAFFSQVYVPGSVIVDGDAAATARNILASEQLFRISIAMDILIFAADVVLAVALYVLLRPVSPGLAMLAMLWRTAQATIMGMNTLSFLVVPSILSGPDELRALSTDQLEALASTYIGVHTAGFAIGLIFLGLGSAVFSYVLYKSNYVPRALSAWGVFANISLAACTLAIIVLPSAGDVLAVQFVRYVPVFFFEVILGVWLLVRGARVRAAGEPATVTHGRG
jgi:hypothetical protein